MQGARSWAGVGILALAVLAAACGTSPPTVAPAPIATAPVGTLPYACSLLTMDQVAAFLGEPVSPPSGGPNVAGADESSCDWQQRDIAAPTLKLVQLQVFAGTTHLPRTGYPAGEVIGDVAIPGASEAFALNEDDGRAVGINMVVGSRRVVIHFRPGTSARDAAARHLDSLKGLAATLAAAVAAAK